MTPTETLLIQLIKECEQVLAAAQRKFPMDSKYDNVVNRIARKRGDISNTLEFVMKSEDDKAQMIVDLLRENFTSIESRSVAVDKVYSSLRKEDDKLHTEWLSPLSLKKVRAHSLEPLISQDVVSPSI